MFLERSWGKSTIVFLVNHFGSECYWYDIGSAILGTSGWKVINFWVVNDWFATRSLFWSGACDGALDFLLRFGGVSWSEVAFEAQYFFLEELVTQRRDDEGKGCDENYVGALSRDGFGGIVCDQFRKQVGV